MTSAIAFSRDRPAQLDLTLRSATTNAPWIGDMTVIYKATSADTARGYHICRGEHPEAKFVDETDFRALVLGAVNHADETCMFLCDDDVIYRRVGTVPHAVLRELPEALCVTLRLGANTTHCYPLRRDQRPPPTRHSGLEFEWRTADGDWGYPGSVDGSVWRTDQLRILIEDSPRDWSSPNELEDALNQSCRTSLLPLMVCYPRSILVGIPANSVQTAYKKNRHGEQHPASAEALNAQYLRGKRLSLATVVPDMVNGAHTEFTLLWEKKAVAA